MTDLLKNYNVSMVLILLALWACPLQAKATQAEAQAALAAWNLMTMDKETFLRSGLSPVKCGTFYYAILASDPVLKAKTIDLRKAAVLDSTYASPRAAGRYLIYYTSAPGSPDAVPDSDAVTLTASGFVPGPDGISDYVEWPFHS